MKENDLTRSEAPEGEVRRTACGLPKVDERELTLAERRRLLEILAAERAKAFLSVLLPAAGFGAIWATYPASATFVEATDHPAFVIAALLTGLLIFPLSILLGADGLARARAITAAIEDGEVERFEGGCAPALRDHALWRRVLSRRSAEREKTVALEVTRGGAVVLTVEGARAPGFFVLHPVELYWSSSGSPSLPPTEEAGVGRPLSKTEWQEILAFRPLLRRVSLESVVAIVLSLCGAGTLIALASGWLGEAFEGATLPLGLASALLVAFGIRAVIVIRRDRRRHHLLGEDIRQSRLEAELSSRVERLPRSRIPWTVDGVPHPSRERLVALAERRRRRPSA